ncbi:MAG: glycosyltransferase [Bacteroidota bacterium]|nr:glycosyltransferase [Bacteroidota bacterium]MEC8757313.1 glycosyltransferase [Bacteroidota bacterium]MEC8835812.1 glycosyltransferase [Bacteroidota bacterium]MEC9222049.1 glycosyltransferase [Bacteroidota bacterium]
MGKQKIRVLRIANRLNIGGPTYNVCYLTKHLGDSFETLLIAGQEDASEGSSLYIAESMGLTPRLIPSMRRSINFSQDHKAYLEVRKIIREFKPHIVHTHAAKAGAIGRYAAYKEKVPVILHTYHGHVFHSYFNKIKTGVFLTIERFLARRSSALIAISPLQQKELSENFKIASFSKFRMVPLGFDLDRFFEDMENKRASFREFWGLRGDVLAIALVGRLVPIKNHPFFLESISFVKNNTKKKFQVFLVGDGEEKTDLMRLCDELNLSYNSIPDPSADVVFTSWIEDVDHVFAGIDLVCLSSKNEGTPVSLIEAGCAGKPFISTDVGGIRDLMVEPRQGIVTPKNNIEAFREALLKWVVSAKPGCALDLDVRSKLAKKYSYKQLCLEMSKVYEELLPS